MSDICDVHVLSNHHADGIQALFTEPDVAAVAGADVGMSLEAVDEYIKVATEAREDGWAYIFVLTVGTRVTGICRLIGVRGVPRLIVGVSAAYRGRGFGAILVRHVLEFAFEKLGVEQVTASGPCLALVSRYGRIEGAALSRAAWMAAQGGSAPVAH